MDATERIIEEFDRQIKEGLDRIPERRFAKRFVFYTVITRCEKDQGGFASLFEQGLDEDQLVLFVDGLRQIDESDLAEWFHRIVESLRANGFYPDRDYGQLSQTLQDEIDVIGEKVGDRLWGLDSKLVTLLDAP